MKVSVEMNSIHDAIMLNAIIEMWKAKWESEEAEDEDDDAEDESENCDDDEECSVFPETAEEKAHRKALEKLAECLRSNGIADVDFIYRRHAIRRNRQR